jgi:hypothetical protein
MLVEALPHVLGVGHRTNLYLNLSARLTLTRRKVIVQAMSRTISLDWETCDD